MRLVADRLGHRGDAVAMGPSGPVFIPRILPGEEVEGEITGDRMDAPTILTPSTDRVRAPCPHYRTCGGCSLQHASDDFVARWKREVVVTALAGQGLEAPVGEVQTSPAFTRRRATLHGRRTKGGALLGFHARASDTLVAVPHCLLLTPSLKAAFPALEALVKAGGSRTAEVSLTVTDTLGGPDVAVTGGKPLDPVLHGQLAQLAERFGLSRLAWEGEVIALRNPPAQAFGPARVSPPPGAFLQATAAGEAALLAFVRRSVGPAKRVADLFAGSGTFALPLAENAEVHAVEGDAAMTVALDRGWRAAPGLKRVTTEARDLFRRPLEPDELKRFDAVVIDPPRAGAEAQVKALARASVPVIAMVSCNPVTFARDARLLIAAGYVLEEVEVVDQFRWSAHVELAARFTRR
ncbi:class I SAM-dependent RNA methyltransferase [Falsirhodobacter sp. 20TX0035]|uniref:class I SAM-dependent RNA methyltransferase n=1 Tax=Falsirhodobacter sp. 20TX0035 TaxID=3022019 RepID=UPI002330072C|nr:class I SAM-dependent RNA methyltransferase [Falsirhodobacter sp. 20TX0035]MDB6452691.1 class I SAM-dependent RNA methyltransferase [Falsirhodobacter sp. 20TX0035]